jgi:putative restriction endonuclease
MANVVFTTKVNPVYDDLPEVRYHFPATYLNQARQAVGDWIVYYEPRREGADLSGRAGRKCYFAIARVLRLEEDKSKTGHYYAYVADYLEFPKPVPFKLGEIYLEAGLRKDDGSTNKGRFGRSVRTLPAEEYQNICRLGLRDAAPFGTVVPALQPLQEEPVDYGRPRKTQIAERPLRDAAFTRVIQEVYDRTCAMTGLKLINGGGRCEIEAAHIKPVSEEGPDSPRNGIALCRTIHWMFDRHFLSISDSGEILVAKKYVPEQVRRMLNPDGRVKLPSARSFQPHPVFLRYHQNLFKGEG